MKDTKESSSKPSGKFSDLFEDLQDTLENSIYNGDYEKIDSQKWDPEKSENIKERHTENDGVSEIFDALNATDFEAHGGYEKTGTPKDIEDIEDIEEAGSKIPRVTPTPSAFDEALKSQTDRYKSKPKPAVKSDLLSDTKEVPVPDSSKRPVKSESPKKIRSINNIDDISDKNKSNLTGDKNNSPEDINGTDYESPEDYNGEGNYDNEDNSDNSDMDLELLKAIGIGQNNARSDENLKQAAAETSVKNKSRENKAANDSKPNSKKLSAKYFNKAINTEYVDREQINEIFSSYRKSYISEFIKLSLGIFLFLILFYMEIAPYIHWKMPNVLNINYFNLPYIWIDLQILVLVAALNFKSLVFGVRSMLASNINLYSISVFFFALAFIHTMLTLYLRYNNPDMVLYNSIAVYSMVLMSLYNLLDMSSEITSFKIVSSKKPKYALNLTSPSQYKSSKPSLSRPDNPYGSAGLESELFRDVIPYDTSVGGIVKTPFISNFFSRTYKDKHIGGILKYFVYISLFVAFGLFIVFMGFLKEKDWYVVLSSVIALMLGSVPMCSFIIEVYPVYRAQKKARAIGSAFIGGKSIEESSAAPIISLYDRDIFPAEQIKTSSIKVFGNNRIDTVLQYLRVVFEKLNMPPADMLKTSTNFDKNFDTGINFVSLDDNGICYISNNQKLFLGTSEYISNLGLIPFNAEIDEAFIKSAGSIMFLATENEIMAKVYIKYEITVDFYDIIKNIKKINACLCIRTFDPNIDDELITKLGNIKKYPIKVLKLKKTADIYAAPERADAPAVSKESLKSLISAILIAGRTKNIIKSNVLIQTVAFAASLLLSVILGFAGQLWGINAGHLFLLQSFWLLPVIIFSGIAQ